MTIDEAIKALEKHNYIILVACNPELNSAMKLGVEALKVYKQSQVAGWYPPGYRLPGETEITSKEVKP